MRLKLICEFTHWQKRRGRGEMGEMGGDLSRTLRRRRYHTAYIRQIQRGDINTETAECEVA